MLRLLLAVLLLSLPLVADGARIGSGAAGGGSGDITDVFDCSTGDCTAVTVENGESLAASGTGTIAATTSAALAANPSDCSAGDFATAIAANGNLTCGAPALSDLTITAGAGLSISSDTISTASSEDDFLAVAADADFNCGVGPGAMAVMQGPQDVLSYCDDDDDGQGDQRYLAVANSSGVATSASTALTGDSATSFFSSGELERTLLPAASADCSASNWAKGIDADLVLDCAQPAFSDISGTLADTQIADGAVDGGSGGEIADGSITADDLATDSVSADELNATGVEAELEAVLDVGSLQGVTYRDVITVDGAACDGTTDDEAAFEAAYDALTTNGGTIFVRNTGSACVFDAPVEVEGNVALECEPGVVLQAKTGSAFTNTQGLFELAENNNRISGCEIDLNDFPTAAIKTTDSEGHAFERLYVHGGDDAAAAGNTLINIDCPFVAAAPCATVANSVIACINSANDTGDTGIFLGGSFSSTGSTISNNSVTGCDEYGINVTHAATSVVANKVITGASGVTDSHGVRLAAGGIQLAGNYILAPASAGSAIVAAGAGSAIAANEILVSGTDTNGILVSAATEIVGNDIRGSGTAGDVLILIQDGGSGTLISGNNLEAADWSVRPARSGAAASNVRIYGNQMWFNDVACVMLATGWHMTGNVCNWVIGDGAIDANIWLGDDGSFDGSTATAHCTTHSSIVGNNFHCNTNGCEAHIWAPQANVTCSLVGISDNQFIGGLRANEPAIDLAEGCTSNCPTFTALEIGGNSSALSSGQAIVAFDSDRTATYTKVNVGPQNAYNGSLVRGWDQRNGMIGALGDSIVLKAARCSGTTATVSADFDLPTTNPAAAGCLAAGTDYAVGQGTLDFDTTTQETVYAQVKLPAYWSGTLAANILWVATAITGTVEFELATACWSDSDDEDPAWNTDDAASLTVDGTAQDLNTSTIDQVTVTGCVAGDILNLRLRRDVANDTMAGDARLLMLELVL